VKISLIEYDAGNLPSVERALARQNIETVRAGTPDSIASAEAVILPGVGHFGQLMRTLAARNLIAPLRDSVAHGAPLLGICLGLQALFVASDEAPGDPGLGLFPGNVAALPATAKLPHMGWNQLRRVRESVLVEGIPSGAYFYFAHTYAALDAGDATVALCDHAAPFVAVLARENVFAVQFHPEKSGDAGARILSNFIAYAKSRAGKGTRAGQ
jgi:imidazole glycerol phosphate synthase glutamine amidotransferase subunit